MSEPEKSYDDLLAENLLLRATISSLNSQLNLSATAACRDFADAKEAAATARLNCQEEFQQILENIPDIIIRLDSAQRITYVNRAICELSGMETVVFIGSKIHQIKGVDPAFIRSFQTSISEVFNHGQILTAEFSFDNNVTLRHFHARYVPEKTSDGKISGALCIFHDITIYKQMLKEIGRLDRLNLIGEMAAGIGHEVRNPMTTVRGFLQVLQRKKEFADHCEFFQLMIEELDRANSIISEFLSLAKNKPVNLEECSLNKIILTLQPLMQADATLTNNYLETELAEIPLLPLDEKEIRQLILNLVRNGVEAMPNGGRILLRTYLEPGHVCLSVSDQGPGIPAEILANIGTPFLTTKINGTGLGLPVCYSIARRHNATLYPKSSPEGTSFIIKFPF